MYEKSCEFIYRMIAVRTSVYKGRYHLKNRDLIPWDPSLASAIAHNRRGAKRNPYLIPTNTNRSDFPLDYVKEIASAFKISAAEYLWGSEKERELYRGALFATIITDALKDDEAKDVVKKALYEYIPYALWCYFIEREESYKYYGFYPKELIPDGSCGHPFELAVARLYKRLLNINLSYTCVDDEHNRHLDNDLPEVFVYGEDEEHLDINLSDAYVDDKDTNIKEININDFFYAITGRNDTYKLNRRIRNAVRDYLLPLLEEEVAPERMPYDPVNNFCHDNDWLVKVQFEHDLGVDHFDHQNEKLSEIDKRAASFARADAAKIRVLCQCQQENEGVPDVSILENRWCPAICLL
jgi:hypothetical protein